MTSHTPGGRQLDVKQPHIQVLTALCEPSCRRMRPGILEATDPP